MAGLDVRGIEGSWHNQLGSCMELRVYDDGRITGTMCSPVGGATGEQPLTGYVEPLAEGQGGIGFVVAWRSTGSVAVWSGHYDTRAGVISTNWLLTGGQFGTNEWQSTRVGHDEFHRVRVSTDGSSSASR